MLVAALWDYKDPCDGCGKRVPVSEATYVQDCEGEWMALCTSCRSNSEANMQGENRPDGVRALQAGCEITRAAERAPNDSGSSPCREIGRE